jgi:hypothetical protein
VLALRIAALFLLGLALARPKIQASGLVNIDQAAPSAVVLIFDTSPSMDLKHEGKTRLEIAREMGRKVLDELSEGSDVVVIDSSTPTTHAPASYVGAVERVDRMVIQPSQRPLSQALDAAFRSLATTQRSRGEVYVFTDLATHAWSLGDTAALRNAFEKISVGAHVYVMNLGVEKPKNISLSVPKLGQQIVSDGSVLTMDVQAMNTGGEADVVLEGVLDGQPFLQRPMKLPADAVTEIPLEVPIRGLGIHLGSVRLKTGDSMPFDDERYFAAEVRPPIRTLVVAAAPMEATHWVNALEPIALRGKTKPRFEITELYEPGQLAEVDLSKFAAVCVLNTGLSDAAWDRLKAFAEAGGGVFVGLGDRVDLKTTNGNSAQALLPAKLESEINVPNATVISADRYLHPVLAPFARINRSDFGQGYVVKYWKTTPNGGAQSILKYANGDPALLEKLIGAGKGKCLMLTTAVHYSPTGYWSELPLRWSYLLLAEQIVRHLASVAEASFNVPVGMAPILDMPGDNPPTQLMIVDPKKEAQKVNLDGPAKRQIRLPTPKWPGNYNVESVDDRKFSSGFSANIPDSESTLDQADPTKIAGLLEKGKLTVAKDLKSLERAVSKDRVGMDLFAYVMVLLLIVISVESWLANRFYKPVPAPDDENLPTLKPAV